VHSANHHRSQKLFAFQSDKAIKKIRRVACFLPIHDAAEIYSTDSTLQRKERLNFCNLTSFGESPPYCGIVCMREGAGHGGFD
jgi:hypothetical protein